MKLDDLVKLKEEEARLAGQIRSHFGAGTDGSILDPWQTNFGRIEMFTRYRGFDEVAPTNYILIRVPRTDSGVDPSNPDDQPFGWDGKINEYAADVAAWWAFEILTDGEAAEFYRRHSPTVVFEYQEGGRGHRLAVRHNGIEWTVIEED